MTISHLFEKRNGLALTFSVKCENCETEEEFCTSPDVNDSTAKRKTKEINMRGVMAFREIGRGLKAKKTFTSVMNMPPTMAQSSFTSINSKLAEAYCETATESCSNAAQEVRSLLKENINDDELVDCHVAIDGTWQKEVILH